MDQLVPGPRGITGPRIFDRRNVVKFSSDLEGNHTGIIGDRVKKRVDQKPPEIASLAIFDGQL